MRNHLSSVFIFSFVLSCGKGSEIVTSAGVCDNYAAPASSDYVLPFPAGTSYRLSQGNCSAVSHFGSQRYAFDFAMPIGSDIVAARAGTVIKVISDNADGNGCPKDNRVEVKHSDGTVALYVHLTKNGSLVNVGDSVTKGQKIARSGNTGCSSSAHLHFVVFKDESQSDSVPISFSNAQPLQKRMKTGIDFSAL